MPPSFLLYICQLSLPIPPLSFFLSFFLSLSLSFSLSHTHTHIHTITSFILYFFNYISLSLSMTIIPRSIQYLPYSAFRILKTWFLFPLFRCRSFIEMGHYHSCTYLHPYLYVISKIWPLFSCIVLKPIITIKSVLYLILPFFFFPFLTSFFPFIFSSFCHGALKQFDKRHLGHKHSHQWIPSN